MVLATGDAEMSGDESADRGTVRAFFGESVEVVGLFSGESNA
jgi:hypothetical protein